MSSKRTKARGRPQRPAAPRVPLSAGTVKELLAVAQVEAPRPARAPALAAGPILSPQPERTGVFEAFVQRNAPEVVGVTYWFDVPADTPVQSVTLRLVGQRLGVVERQAQGDGFVHEETWNDIVAGSGPIAVTSKLRDVTPGEWQVRARAYSTPVTVGSPRRARRELPVHRAGWSWRRWRIIAEPDVPVRSRLAPLVRPPAVVLGSWFALVILGIALGLTTQLAILASKQVQLGRVIPVSMLVVLAGVAGGKAWYVLLHRRERRRDGWALQGFVTGVTVTAPILLWLLAVPAGPYLDAAAPGLMIGAATGRLGCFLTGCCAGRPTASRWGIWSSNRRIGARRVPIQLIEAALALAVGIGVLVAIAQVGFQHGGLFVVAVAAYTAVRQSLLLLREEGRQSRLGPFVIAAAAGATLTVDLIVLAIL